MKLDKKFVIISIIISIIVAWSVAYFQFQVSKERFLEELQQQENIQLIERINNAESIAKTCNITNKNEVLTKLTQARHNWAYKNYTASEELLNSVRNDIANCIVTLPSARLPVSILLISIITLTFFITIFRWPKNRRRTEESFRHSQ